jgi:hypothetical protein
MSIIETSAFPRFARVLAESVIYEINMGYKGKFVIHMINDL